VSEPKEEIDATDWRSDDIPPKYAPCFVKHYPQRNGWQWRSARIKAKNSEREYILLCQCHIAKDDWKSVLILKKAQGGSVISRYEFHADHSGLHVHANCSNGGERVGPTGMTMGDADRLPRGGNDARRINAWTKESFWQESKRFFRIQNAPLAQGELNL